MVLLHIKQQDKSLFLFETTTDVRVGQIVEQVVQIQNDIIRMLDITKGTTGKFEYIFPY